MLLVLKSWLARAQICRGEGESLYCEWVLTRRRGGGGHRSPDLLCPDGGGQIDRLLCLVGLFGVRLEAPERVGVDLQPPFRSARGNYSHLLAKQRPHLGRSVNEGRGGGAFSRPDDVASGTAAAAARWGGGWHDLVLLMARTASARHPTLQDCRQRTCLRQPRVAQNWPSRCLTSRTARMAHSCQVGLGVGKPSQLPAACTRKSLCLSRGSLIVTEKKA